MDKIQKLSSDGSDDCIVLNELLFKWGVRPVLNHIAAMCEDCAIHHGNFNFGMADKDDILDACDLRTIANNLRADLY